MMSKMKAWLLEERRHQVEAGVVLFVLSCACFVFLSSLKMSQTAKFDGGKLVYQGQMVRGKMNGQGSLTFENGDKYVGQFVDGNFQGQGIFTSSSGWVYEGQFVKGLAQGQGKLTTEAAIIYEGKFEAGIYQDAN